MELKTGYKHSDVGMIPDGWELSKLQDLTSRSQPITYGVLKPGDYVPDGVPLLQIQDVIYGDIKIDELHRISTKLDAQYSRTRLAAGDLVVSLVGTVGRVASIPDELAGANLHRNLALIRISPRHSPRFVFHYLKSEMVQKSIKLTTFGTTQALLNLFDLRQLLIAVPRIAEQEAIAEALGDTDALIESLEQLLAKKRHLKQGVMQELLTGRKRLPGFSGDWVEIPLRRFVRQFIVPIRDKPKRLTGDIPWCRIEDFDGTYLRGSKSGQGVDIETVRAMNLKVYSAGTLLVSCSADLGRCAIVAQPLVSNQTFIGLEMDEAASSNVFFYYFLTSRAEELNNLSSGTTISYLSREQFEEFIVFVPIDKREQTAIAAILSDMDADIVALEAKLTKARQLKEGMMQELLTGRIRLL